MVILNKKYYLYLNNSASEHASYCYSKYVQIVNCYKSIKRSVLSFNCFKLS